MTTTSDSPFDKDNDYSKDLFVNNPQILPSNKKNPFAERNIFEEKKVKIISNNDSFSFNLNIYGKTIFDNLFLLISTSVNANNTELIYKWKRIKENTAIPLKDINTRMYILSAEDIGCIIDVEVKLKQYPNKTAHAQYGPIEFTKEMKNIITLLLSKESISFHVNSYIQKEKEEDSNNSKVIYYYSNEFTLNNIDNNHNKNETEVERCKYIPFNPIITLNQFDPLRFSITFYTYEYEDTDSSTIKLKSQREYDLISLSKQSRELIYLLFRFRSIEEELRQNKQFALVNFNSIPSEMKDSMIDLLEELSKTKEENKLMIGNIKYLEYINNNTTKNLKRLEEDYQITLETINAIDCCNLKDKNNTDNKPQSKKNSQSDISTEVLIHSHVLKAKHDRLLEENKALIEKTKSNNEEIDQLAIKEEQYINLINKKDIELGHIRDAYLELKSQNSQLIQDNSKLTKEVKRIRNEFDKDNEANNNKTKLEKNELEVLKNKLLEILTDKNSIEREYNKLQKEKENIELDLNNQNEHCKAIKILIESKDLIVNQLLSELNDIKNETNLLQNEITKLKEAMSNNQINFNKSEQSLTNQLNKLSKERNAFETQMDQMGIELRGNANDKRLIRLALQTKEEEMKEIVSRLDLALEENKEIQSQYNNVKQENIQLQELYGRIKDKQDLNYSQDSFIDIKRSEMFEELNQLKREKDETEAYILKLKYNNEKQASEIEKLKKIIKNQK